MARVPLATAALGCLGELARLWTGRAALATTAIGAMRPAVIEAATERESALQGVLKLAVSDQ